MAGISGMFNIGRLALFASQNGLAVTSQNIANVNTPGYTRQEAVLEATRPVSGQPGQIGTGVAVTEIRRIVDRFVENQITSGESNLGRLQTKERFLRRVESVFTDAQGTGMNQALSDLFAALQDLSVNPQNQPERVVLLERGEALVQQIGATDAQLQQIRKDINSEIIGNISDINLLTGRIADLNGQISQVEITGQQANDLRDQRQILLNDLSKQIDVSTLENELGELTVFMGGGKLLVEGRLATTLRGLATQDNTGFVTVSYDPGTGSTTDITAAITNGRLKGLIDLRDIILPETINQLDQLAAGMINEVNQQHRLGYGLDGSTGNDFFSPLSPTATGLSTNTGAAAVGVTVSDPASLTLDGYDLTFAGGSYTVRNKDTGATSTGAYVDPTTITFEGLQISISGAPANGDTFQISAHKGSAGSIAVAITDPDLIAASGSATALPGDNSNALLLASLQEKRVTAFGGATFQSFYSGFVGKVGAQTRLSQNSLSVEEVIQEQLSGMREETSGVSLDEEMTNLIKFQRAYEASARIITIADEMLQTVIAMV